MNIAFVGAGKVGTTLGLYFKNHGFKVLGYYSRTLESANYSAELTKTKVYTTMEELLKESNLIFITTNDDQIEVVDNELGSCDELNNRHMIVHTSGAHPSNIMKKVQLRCCQVASIHPLQSFADVQVALQNIEKTVFTIEGDNLVVETLKAIIRKTNNQFLEINSDQKALYHAGACVMSNYLVTLMDYGLELFQGCGLKKESIFDAMLPLIEGTLDNIKKVGTVNALTGPIVRGDESTISSHIKAGKEIMADEMELYKVLARKTLDMIDGKRIDNEKLMDMKAILNE